MFTEPSPCGLPYRGWLGSALPLRAYEAEDPIVAVPRGTADQVDAWVKAFPNRSCYYAGWDGRLSAYDVRSCDAAAGILSGSEPIPTCLRTPPTASQWGLLPAPGR